MLSLFFFFNDTATTEIYTLSLHDALPICSQESCPGPQVAASRRRPSCATTAPPALCWSRPRRPVRNRRKRTRSEEHTSELQSRQYLVCRLLLEKKKKHQRSIPTCITNKIH